MIKRVKCRSCQREVFLTERCTCGASLSESGEEIEATIIAPKLSERVSAIINEWFLAYWSKNEDQIDADHVTIAKQLGYIYDEEKKEDGKF